MPVYRKLRDIDVLRTTLTASPRVSIVSGTDGYIGGPDGTGSVSVYTGFRGPGSSGVTALPVVHPGVHDVGMFQPISGTYPLTASVRWVDVLLEDRDEDRYTWGNRSWRPIERLYEYYSRYNTNYSTDVYDYQCLFNQRQNTGIFVAHDGQAQVWTAITASMTLEAWVKPFSTSSLNYSGFTVMARNRIYRLFLTGTDGRLAFTSSIGLVTSSISVPLGSWSHVALAYTAGTGSLYINLKHAATFSGVIASSQPSFNPCWTVGSTFDGNVTSNTERPDIGSGGDMSRAFHGLIHEPREWGVGRTWSEISSSHSGRLRGTETGLVNYNRMTWGHRSGTIIGSASINDVLNYPHSHSIEYGGVYSPTWQPCDNPRFYPDRSLMRHADGYSKSRFRVFNIPRLFYGRQIATGSVEIMCRAWSNITENDNGDNCGMIRVIRDDGRGSLYVKSYLSSSIDDETDECVTWNRVGNVFYSEGVIVITDDSMLDLGDPGNASSAQPEQMLSLSFRGTSLIPTRMVSCRVDPGQANASVNPTYYTVVSGSDRYELVDESRTTWVTGVALYDDRGRLVGVAKLATPMRKRERDRINFRLKFDL